MIEKEKVARLVDECLAETDVYLVEVKVSKTNIITITLDSDSAVTIDTCVKVSRHVESNLDREVEDYELNVSSAGIDDALKVRRQYEKYINAAVYITENQKEKQLYRLENVNEEELEVVELKEKKYGKLTKIVEGDKKMLNFVNIQEVKPYIKL